MVVALVFLTGYLVAYPALVWTLHDLRRLDGRPWAGYGNAHTWRVAAVDGYAATGLPAVLVAWEWSSGRTRTELVAARRHAHDDHPHSVIGSGTI